MQTREKRQDKTSTGTSKNRPIDQKKIDVQSKIRRLSTTKSSPGIAFNSCILKHTPTKKSGCLFSDYGFGNDVYASKWEIIKIWHALLKQFDKYKPIKVNENDSLQDVMNTMKIATDKLCKGYQWKLMMNDENGEPRLYYYKYKNDVDCYTIPLDWLNNHESKPIKRASLEIIRRIAHKFHLDIIDGYLFDNETDNFSTYDECAEYVIQMVGEEEDNTGVKTMIDHYWSYVSPEGEPFRLKKQLKSNYSKNIKSDLVYIKTNYPAIWKWLDRGLKLLDESIQSFYLEDFVFDEYNMTNSPDEGFLLNCAIFFPYTYNDSLFNTVDSYISDIISNTGFGGIYEYGFVQEIDNSFKPKNYKNLKSLLAFMQAGNQLYHRSCK